MCIWYGTKLTLLISDKSSVSAQYYPWSMWMASHARRGCHVFNTEYRKCPSSGSTALEEDFELSEELLIELLTEKDVSDIAGKQPC